MKRKEMDMKQPPMYKHAGMSMSQMGKKMPAPKDTKVKLKDNVTATGAAGLVRGKRVTKY